jgi:hypothetical protein
VQINTKPLPASFSKTLKATAYKARSAFFR